MTAQIALFDIDGVLLHSGGYRAGLRQSLAYFLAELGLDDGWAPDEHEVTAFESIGITAEWDMIPIWLAFILERMAQSVSDPIDWPDWAAVVAWARSKRLMIERRPLSETILAIRPFLSGGIVPSEVVLEACVHKRFDCLQTITSQGVFRQLLGNTRDLAACRTTQVFQSFILGSETYARLYEREPPITCRSALEELDRPILRLDVAARIDELRSQQLLAAAAFTARPSLSLNGQAAVRAGYSPEAEIALSILGMSHLPLIGYGAMVHTAEQYGLRADGLLKPAPFQALAAIAAAWTGEVLPSLEWAYAYSRRFEGDAPPPAFGHEAANFQSRLPVTFDVHVFEDTRSGIVSARRAAEYLQSGGFRVRVNAWGIAENGEKKTALEQVGAVIYPDINQAVRAAFPHWF